MNQQLFSPDPARHVIAQMLYDQVAGLPLICPHGHVHPRLFADPHYDWGTPVDLFIIPDHYIFRMLYSQGIALEALGIKRNDGAPIETDHRKIWQTVCDHWYLFHGTPTGIWLGKELREVYGINLKMNSANAQQIYDALTEKLKLAEFQPRPLFERFNIEVLATTDSASDRLEYHQAIRDSGWRGRIIPTFRPDAVVNIDIENWLDHLRALSDASGIEVGSYHSLIAALENRRAYFKEMGATATDHGAASAYTERLSDQEAETIFSRARNGQASADDARRFTGHLLLEMARMSTEDGLVMQLHIGSYRNHNTDLFAQFGRDMGSDIPLATEYTRNLRVLLQTYGNHPQLTLVLFTLDESTYSRELAPLAGHYPAVRLGPPWWFFDSVNGMTRYFDSVIETAGIFNTAGFNDDTRAYPSIPARHDVWRRVSADWLSGLVVRGIIDEEDASMMIHELAYHLAKRTYKFS